jgi:hypothetical protein
MVYSPLLIARPGHLSTAQKQVIAKHVAAPMKLFSAGEWHDDYSPCTGSQLLPYFCAMFAH